MAEQQKQNKKPSSTEEKMGNFDLDGGKGCQGRTQRDRRDARLCPLGRWTLPLSESEAAAFEYSIMMQQYEALLADYQRREAEEQAEKAKAQEGDGQA